MRLTICAFIWEGHHDFITLRDVPAHLVRKDDVCQAIVSTRPAVILPSLQRSEVPTKAMGHLLRSWTLAVRKYILLPTGYCLHVGQGGHFIIQHNKMQAYTMTQTPIQ